MVVVSGLALGVDDIALQAATNTKGQTIAVLTGGLENIYPATNRPIADSIVKTGGTLICEKHTPFKVAFFAKK